MKIKNVEVFPIEFPLEFPSQDATGVWDNWSTVIVKVTSENGVAGYGEVGPLHGGGLPAVTGLIESRLKKLVIGEDCFQRERLFEKMVGRGTSAYALGPVGATVSAAAGVAAGVVSSIFTSPVGGAAIGTATGVAIDKGLLKLEEIIKRDEYKKEIISSIEESRQSMINMIIKAFEENDNSSNN